MGAGEESIRRRERRRAEQRESLVEGVVLCCGVDVCVYVGYWMVVGVMTCVVCCGVVLHVVCLV
jgi:hypothetical protein